MRIALIGRTVGLIEAGRRALARGHSIGLVWTAADSGGHAAGLADFQALARLAGAAFRVGRHIPPDLPAAAGCELALSVNWPSLLPSSVLSAFPLGVLNAHAGDLPRYRGNACPNWAILQGEPHVGLCVHLMVEALDAGPVLLREHFPLGCDTYIGEVYRWIMARIPEMLVAAGEGLAEGRLRPVPQDEAMALRCYPRRPSDGRIDWSASAETILRLVRATSRPFDGAWSMLEAERRLTVWRASHIDAGRFLAVPGQVCFADRGMPVIATGEGCLRLDDMMVEGAEDEAAARRAVLRSLRHRLV